MFSKGNKATTRRASLSIIGTDCTFTGDVLSQGEVQIDGRIDGDIRCDILVIGESGVINGEISADTIRVLGSVTGQITARVVELAKTARILGDITHEQLSVEAGARVEGRFNRKQEEPAAKTSLTEDAPPMALLTGSDGDKTVESGLGARIVILGN